MTATSGMENAVGSGKISTKDDRLHRGRKVTSAFLMQGWGQFFNQAILILLLLIFHHGRLVTGLHSLSPTLLIFIKWKSAVFDRCSSVDVPSLLCNSSGWHIMASLLPYLQNEVCQQATRCC